MYTAAVTNILIKTFFWRHGISTAITSDRKSQFVSDTWQHIYKLLNEQRCIPNAYLPQTDGSNERMNQTVEGYIRRYCTYRQFHWTDLLSMCELAITDREAASTGVSPFCTWTYQISWQFLRIPQPPLDAPSTSCRSSNGTFLAENGRQH